jgi:hypothetical protein
MKKLSLIAVLFIAACAPRFDSNELMLAAQIKTLAENGLDQCDINPKLALDSGRLNIVPVAHLMYNHSSALPNNADTATIIANIRQIANTVPRETPSKTFCKEKFKNIIQGADRVLRVINRKEVE